MHRRKRNEGDTYVITKDERGEVWLRCKACNVRVRPVEWWQHKCSVTDLLKAQGVPF